MLARSLPRSLWPAESIAIRSLTSSTWPKLRKARRPLHFGARFREGSREFFDMKPSGLVDKRLNRTRTPAFPTQSRSRSLAARNYNYIIIIGSVSFILNFDVHDCHH